MLKSKLVDILKHFNSKELNKFQEFLQSPYFNKDEEVKLLYAYMKPYGPEFTSQKIDKEYILRKGVPGLELTEKKLGYLMNYLVEYAEEYIQVSRFLENKAEGQIMLLQQYNKWNADKFFEKVLNKVQSDTSLFPYKDNEYLLFQYRIESEATQYFDRLKVRTYDPSLQKAADYLDLFYISTKLKYLCELMNRQQLVAANYEMRLLNEIFIHVRDQQYEQSPAVTVYYQILMLFMEPDETTHYPRLKELLVSSKAHFSPEEARDIFTYAQNYCIARVNKGNPEFLKELFELYKISIEDGFIAKDGIISPWAFKNIVSVATRVQEIAWAEKFISKCISQVDERFRENAFNYNNAYLLYAQKKYGKALQMLNAVEYSDVFYALDSRTLQIKLYYDMNEVTPMISALDAFRVYLRRNKIISESMRLTYSNFVRFADKLMKYSHDKEKMRQLHADIRATGQVADMNWLLAKTTV